jgi:ankyrin repeat protein
MEDVTAKYFQDIREGNVDAVADRLKRWPTWAYERNQDGISPIMMALYHDQPACIRLLISQGIELDFHESCALGSVPRVRLLLELEPEAINAYSADGFTALHLAAFFNEPEVVAILLENGAPINAEAQNYMHVQPLHSAVAGKSLSIAEGLLKAGANVNAQQQHDFTALHAAAQDGSREMAELLLRYGASKLIRDDKGRSAADLASSAGHADLAAMLA